MAPDSVLGRTVGTAAEVPSHHHQAVDRLGRGIRAVGWAEDDVVEAVEVAGHRFAVGVQWHPEQHPDDRLFAALVNCA